MEDLSNIAEGQDQIQREQWERTRDIIYWGFLPNAKNPKQLKKEKLIAFPWDKKAKPKTESEKKSMVDYGNKLVEIMKNGAIKPITKTPELKE